MAKSIARASSNAALRIAAAALVLSSGCVYVVGPQHSDLNQAHYQAVATEIDYPQVSSPPDQQAASTLPPWTVDDIDVAQFRDLTLEEAVQTALINTRVLRDLGARILDAPDVVGTTFDPAIRETDGRFGVEAALSAYDAMFSVDALHQHNDRAINNQFLGGGTNVLRQETATVRTELNKTAMTGTEFALRQITDYDDNTAPGNLFRSSWNTNVELGIRQPLMQGAGVNYNRIAGPNATPGFLNGVLLARVNTDISLADFEQGVTRFVSNVENVYWDLYFAYRDLDAKIKARDAALETWRRVKALNLAGRVGGEEENEAQALEQYYRFQEAVQTALSGRLVEGTRDNNGSRAGTFRGLDGVQVAERRLRLLMGLPLADGQLLRPADEPTFAEVVFSWESLVPEALERRVELRRQRWLIKRQELELAANRNFLMPQLDAVGLYRFRGFGKDLFRQHDGSVNGQFNNAWGNLGDGDFQEWQLGANLTIPIGYRQAHSAVRNSELRLARERAVLAEQERDVILNVSDSVGETKRAFAVVKTSINRMEAAQRQFDVLQDKFNKELISDLDLVLEAQRRYAEAESAYFRSRVEYALALKNVFYSKGSLLETSQVYLEEGPWPFSAYRDAEQRIPIHERDLSQIYRGPHAPVTVSGGEYQQFQFRGDVGVARTGEVQSEPPREPNSELAPPPMPAEPKPETLVFPLPR